MDQTSNTFLSQSLSSINSQKPIKSVLDVGCGYGDLSDAYRQLYPGHWVGIETNAEGVEKFKTTAKYNYIMIGEVLKFTSPGDKSFNVGFIQDRILLDLSDEDPYTFWQRMVEMCEFVFLFSPYVYKDRHEKILNSYPYVKMYRKANYDCDKDNIYIASKWHEVMNGETDGTKAR